ncbi:MAG: hypothetical protein ACOZCL_03075 [Bacillota bacterium]
MIENIVNNLKTKEILSNNDVKELRDYIADTYPDSGSEQHAVILANTIKTIINNNISQFDDEYKKTIRDSVLKKTTYKRIFSIDAEEMLSCCLSLKISEDAYAAALTDWINDNQDIRISRKEVKDFISIIKDFNEEIIQYNLDAVIKRISANPQAMPEIKKPEQRHENEKEHSVYSHGIGYLKHFFEILKEYVCKIGENVSMLSKIKINYRTVISLFLAVVCISAFSFYSKSAASADEMTEEDNAAIKQLLSASYILEQYKKENTSSAFKHLYAAENDLHEDLKYYSINSEALKEWLKGRKSILAEEKYFDVIIETSKKYNVNPLLLFAIAGQEQSFVPSDSKYSAKIANNPFNVYGSWKKYNTNIKDSSAIAARTILNLSRNRPSDKDPIEWINRKYAEDKNWWKNVKKIFETLKKVAL